MTAGSTDIDAYLAGLPDDARATLEQLRLTIRSLAPEADESISYGIPTFKYRGKPLVYFGAAKNHCALYGTPQGTLRFQPGEPPSDEYLQALISERKAKIEAGKKRSRPNTER